MTISSVGSAPVMTEAFKKIDAYRDAISLIEGTTKILCPILSCVVYLRECANKWLAVGYSGRGKKVAFKHLFNEQEFRDDFVSEFMEKSRARVEDSKPKLTALCAGDVLSSAWGYDQTNYSYFMVVRLVGKTMVELVEIGQIKKIDKEHGDRGTCIPDTSRTIGEAFRKKASGDAVRIESYKLATLKRKIDLGNGVAAWSADQWTAYH